MLLCVAVGAAVPGKDWSVPLRFLSPVPVGHRESGSEEIMSHPPHSKQLGPSSRPDVTQTLQFLATQLPTPEAPGNHTARLPLPSTSKSD